MDNPPLPILLDVDTGADDALALLLAVRSPALDVRAITCVAGNHPLSNVVDNTLRLLDFVDAPDVPVAAGMQQPLLEAMRPPFPLHGNDGMADLGLPSPRRKPVGEHAVELMRRTLQDADEPLTVVALAPLTNIAVFLRMYPDLHAKIARIVSMGGTFRVPGNTSPTAEFNVRQDPEAAAMVLESGLPVTLYPLDPFRQVRFNRGEIADFLAADDVAAQTAGRIMLQMCDYFPADSALIGDAGTVAMVVDPEGATTERLPITVDLAGGVNRGRTVFDERSQKSRSTHSHWWQTSQAAIDVVARVDADRYRRLFAGTLGVQVGG
jgi:pyrimidine-specific ribonucleoside hydrolase